MINSISGKIFKKEPTMLYVENNGIVFSISICLFMHGEHEVPTYVSMEYVYDTS